MDLLERFVRRSRLKANCGCSGSPRSRKRPPAFYIIRRQSDVKTQHEPPWLYFLCKKRNGSIKVKVLLEQGSAKPGSGATCGSSAPLDICHFD